MRVHFYDQLFLQRNFAYLHTIYSLGYFYFKNSRKPSLTISPEKEKKYTIYNIYTSGIKGLHVRPVYGVKLP